MAQLLARSRCANAAQPVAARKLRHALPAAQRHCSRRPPLVATVHGASAAAAAAAAARDGSSAQPPRATRHARSGSLAAAPQAPLAAAAAWPQRGGSCRARPPAGADLAQLAQPDLLLQHPSGAAVAVFGVEHLERQPHIGEWVLAERPAAVVVETACTPEHGAAPGRAVTCRDQVQGAAGMFLRVFCQIAAALQEQGEATFAPGGVWSQAAGQFNGEQLAYIAALARGSQLLFGDRPKDITYRRLFAIPSLAELDAAFAAEVTAAYAFNLLAVAAGQQQQEQQAQHAAAGGADLAALEQQAQQAQQQLASTCVWRVLMQEREAVMLGVVDRVCSTGLLLAPGGPQPTVALVVGAAHLPGLQELWDSGAWRDMVGEGGLTSDADGSSSTSPVLQAPRLDAAAMAAPGAGVRRGLLEAVLQLSMPEEVMDDLQDVLPPVSDEAQAQAREWTFEIFSTCRMQLAALPEALLAQVCGAVEGVSMPKLLAPLAALRPANGGPGWDAELGMQLRGLNFDLEPGHEE